jgi:hypothetical protein
LRLPSAASLPGSAFGSPSHTTAVHSLARRGGDDQVVGHGHDTRRG